MVLRPARTVFLPVLTFALVSTAPAATLRLVSSTVGPVSIAAGANGATQTIEAYNAAGGTLSLSTAVSSQATWLTATVGASRACTTTTAVSSCIPLQFGLNTAALAAGIYTGIVTVSDPNAVDSPQTITVTVQMGGGVPSSLDVYVAPGTASNTYFSTNSSLNGRPTTTDGNVWLSLVLQSTASFQFVIPYSIRVAPQAGNTAGNTYTGTLTTSGSSLAAENRAVPVTMHVTTQPIAQTSTPQLNLRLAQGAPAEAVAVAVTNAGQGNLTIASASVTGLSGVTAATYSSGALLTFDPTGLSPGTYNGSLTITSNAANTLAAIPIAFQVVAQAAPTILYQGVVDNATFKIGDPVAQGDIVVVVGEQFSFSPLTVGQPAPLATTVGDATVLVNGTPAPMYYSSYGQLAFQMPFNAPVGTNLIQVQRSGVVGNTVSVTVAAQEPRLLLVYGGPYGAIVNYLDGSLPLPASYSQPGYLAHPAKIGDTLEVYAIGLGATNPSVPAGSAPPGAYAVVPTLPTVSFGDSIAPIQVTPLFAGLVAPYAGLYQINVTIPPGVPSGNVPISIAFGNLSSNTVEVAIQ